MFRAKDDVHPLLLRMAACLTLALSLIASGCSGMTGLRSVGTDRPSLLSFWDRSQPPAPDPAADYYARYMHSARDRADAMAKRSPGSSEPDPGEAGGAKGSQGDEVIASRPLGKSNSAIAGKPLRDDTIRVTLGPPEPLPALSGSSATTAQDANLASTRASSQSNGNRRLNADEAEPRPAPGLARHADDPDEDRREPRKMARTPAPKRQSPSQSTARDTRTPDPKALLAQSEARIQSLNTYQVKISRTERVAGRILPEEQIILSIRS